VPNLSVITYYSDLSCHKPYNYHFIYARKAQTRPIIGQSPVISCLGQGERSAHCLLNGNIPDFLSGVEPAYKTFKVLVYNFANRRGHTIIKANTEFTRVL